MLKRFFKIGIFILIALQCLVPVAADEIGVLKYKASYNGVFSLFKNLDIAEVRYSVENLPAANSSETIKQVRLEVSSENFATVERLYPFRYLFKSFYQPANSATLFFEHLKTTKKSRKKQHRIGLLGHAERKIQLFQSSQFKELITADNVLQLSRLNFDSLAARFDLKVKDQPILKNSVMPIDRMTMLELISEQVKQQQSQKTYLVTNAKKLFNYRVSLQKQEDYKLGDKLLSSQKVKIEAFDLEPAAEVQFAENDYDLISQAQAQPAAADNHPGYAHAPVYAWFSLSEKPVALKFVNQHSVGDFIIEMVPDAGA
jgi:hypothetical protein